MKNKWFGVVLGIAVTFMAYQAWAENITISTYYPSPYGSYTQLDAVTTLNVGTTGAPSIVMTGATGNLVANGSVSGSSLSAGAGAITGGSVNVTGAVQGGSVTTAGAVQGGSVTTAGAVTGASLVTNGMTIRGVSANVGELQVVLGADGKYYAKAVYA